MNASPQLRYCRLPLEALLPHPQNYNQHPDSQLKELEADLLRFGQIKPVVVLPVSGSPLQDDGLHSIYYHLTGHGLHLAAQRLVDQGHLQFRELEAIIAPPDWTPEQARGYMVADNETARKSQVNQDQLLELLQEQQKQGVSLHSVGSSQRELEQLLRSCQIDHATDFLQPILSPTSLSAPPVVLPSVSGKMQAEETMVQFLRDEPNRVEAHQEDLIPREEEKAIPSSPALPQSEQFFPMTFPFTMEQRQVILAALRRSKQVLQVASPQAITSMEALAALGLAYLEQRLFPFPEGIPPWTPQQDDLLLTQEVSA